MTEHNEIFCLSDMMDSLQNFKKIKLIISQNHNLKDYSGIKKMSNVQCIFQQKKIILFFPCSPSRSQKKYIMNDK